ncbi:hypothetical protein [Chitinophaga sp. LS1]|uniref:hypothetical protein n=1 Tax=Chitinophaga sp. LS1 TaxID=3051176 RepID=UPI002AAC198D|nr:hypothetical protein [Chitinophaga sp. LS1]WPV67553.1 hypothetical protein QQL36_02290 [Chitinophaga sp. LS1]
MAYLIKDSTKWLDGNGENVYLKVLRQVEDTYYFPFAMKEYGYKKQQVGCIEFYFNESGNEIFVHPKSPSYYLN